MLRLLRALEILKQLPAVVIIQLGEMRSARRAYNPRSPSTAEGATARAAPRTTPADDPGLPYPPLPNPSPSPLSLNTQREAKAGVGGAAGAGAEAVSGASTPFGRVVHRTGTTRPHLSPSMSKFLLHSAFLKGGMMGPRRVCGADAHGVAVATGGSGTAAAAG
jgi:hypothetical protein